MKKTLPSFILAAVMVYSLSAQETEKQFIRENINLAKTQVENMMKTPFSATNMPHSANKNGELVKHGIQGWTAGFFPATLWYLSEYTGDGALADSAKVWTDKMESVKTYTGNHDIGFMMYCPYGNSYRIKQSDDVKDILVESAKSLTTRFNPASGTIKSWNRWHSWNSDEVFDHPVIIDNMMNLELLFFASSVTGDNTFKDIAITHAETTMKNQVRKDGSTIHVCAYDSETGKYIKGETSQGYSDNSTWSRGQAWAIYGFTMVYRETKDKRFLKTAIKTADYYLNHNNLPSDKIPWWDFNAYQPGYKPGVKSKAINFTANYRDASAAAITASALFELSTFVKGNQSKKYYDAAVQILHSLGRDLYRAKAGENANFILKHCVGAIPHNSEIDVPLVYADYYFVEALVRYDALLGGNKIPFAK